MKKSKILLLFAAIVMSLNVFAQPVYEVGQQNLSFGIGFGSPWVFRTGYYAVIPPVSVAYDYGLRDDYGPGIISVGGYFGITNYRYDGHSTVDFEWSYTSVIFMGRAGYHYEFTNELDTYGGVCLGFRTLSVKEHGDRGLTQIIIVVLQIAEKYVQ